MKHYHLILGLTLAAAALFSCGTNKAQVGVLTKPTSATTNVPGAEYPKINPDLSTVFRNDFPDAQSVSVNVGGKNYEMTKGEDGIWEATTEPLVPGFHYYTLTVDGERVSDPNSQKFFGYQIPAPEGVEITAFYGITDDGRMLLASGETMYSMTLPER